MESEDTKKPTFDELVRSFEVEILMCTDVPSIERLLELVDALSKIIKTRGLREAQFTEPTIENRYTRLASAIAHVATHPAVKITHQQLGQICRRKQQFAYIFNASGYRNMQHLVALSGSEADGKVQLNLAKAATLLAFLSIDDVSDELMAVSLRQPPRVLLTLMLGWLNQRGVLTEQGEKNRTKLLASGALIEDVEIADNEIPYIVNAYMYCSYACSPTKHELKRSLNRLLKNRLNRAEISAKPTKYRKINRPKMLVCNERFFRAHAMFRCYSPIIEALGKRFELVSLSDPEMIDEQAEALFTKTIKLEKPRQSIKDMVQLIEDERPDAIYYPSLGMSHWTVMLSNLRLAPVQFMSYGHPGTSMSSQIDYGFAPGFEGDVTSIFSEKILDSGANCYFAVHSQLPETLPHLLPPSDREVRVAVNSKVMKLSHRMLSICRRLVKEANVPVRFSFFPGERGLFFDGLYAAIKAVLPQADVIPYCDYDSFLREMAKCDLALASFPFGNTNSTVDTCLLGLPTIARAGSEYHGQTDRIVLTAAGYPGWLVAGSDDEYYDKALQLINHPEFRKDLLKDTTRDKTRAHLFQFDESTKHDAAVRTAAAFGYAYDHHQSLRQSSVRHIPVPT